MTKSTKQIYKEWLEFTTDHRYLRRKRWDEIFKVINQFKLKRILEFGCGISTLLFDNLNLKVDSFETDKEFMNVVSKMCSPNINFNHWDNETEPELGYYNLALVDGSLPRTLQTELAISHADFVAIDDCAGRFKIPILTRMKDFQRLDSGTTFMTIFKIR